MKRFRISEQRQLVEKFDSLPACVEWLRTQDLGLHDYLIEDLEEDMEVDADDVLDAFNEGEYLHDLSFF